ncbi:MAG TPA: ribosome maturation factor RimP [Actinomycetota bacterium]|nr:ribosome maturation factor RimP [Actinomycetota bacterium]
MARLEASPAVRAICQAVADRQQVELVDVRFGRSGRDVTLEVVVDREGNVDFDLITEVSRDLSDALDEDEDLIEGSYMLEVSSAGLERPLMKPADYERFHGREVKAVLRQQVEGRNQYRGTITGAGDEAFTLQVQGRGPVEIPYEVVKKANLWVDWEEELRKAEEHRMDDGDEMPRRRRKKSLEGRG